MENTKELVKLSKVMHHRFYHWLVNSIIGYVLLITLLLYRYQNPLNSPTLTIIIAIIIYLLLVDRYTKMYRYLSDKMSYIRNNDGYSDYYHGEYNTILPRRVAFCISNIALSVIGLYLFIPLIYKLYLWLF